MSTVNVITWVGVIIPFSALLANGRNGMASLVVQLRDLSQVVAVVEEGTLPMEIRRS